MSHVTTHILIWNYQMYFSVFLTFCWPCISVDAQNFCFTISLFHASTYFQHMCLKHVEAWNKLIVKQKFCASSWLITEISISVCHIWATMQYYFYLLVTTRHLHGSTSKLPLQPPVGVNYSKLSLWVKKIA